MRIFNKLRGTRGIVKSWQDGLHNQESVHRARVLAFWKKHGLLATKEAFGVSRSDEGSTRTYHGYEDGPHYTEHQDGSRWKTDSDGGK